jgi:hypothetical protein
MKKIGIKITILCILGVLLCWGAGFSANDESRLVQGIGYPPVKAKSRAQALLMARRAAVLDAYRNAVRGREEDREVFPERDDYESFSAFVRGITLVDEALLADGGVQVTVKAPPGNILPPERGDAAAATRPDRKPETYTGPIRVSEDEWYGIIEQMVRFEGKTRKKGE